MEVKIQKQDKFILERDTLFNGNTTLRHVRHAETLNPNWIKNVLPTHDSKAFILQQVKLGHQGLLEV